MAKVNFQTADGVTIVGDFYPAADDASKEALLLLHMMPATKESWQKFAQKASQAGWNVLAIDLRGHGESTKQNGRLLDYRRFDDTEHQTSLEDIEAASHCRRSIGANLAFWYQNENREIIKTVLLSAGFDYRGIETKPLTEKLSNPKEVQTLRVLKPYFYQPLNLQKPKFLLKSKP